MPIGELELLADLPRALIRARISKGLTQKELAERLGIKEQQIQKYEATEYASASLSRVRAVIDALGVKLKNGDELLSRKRSLSILFDRLDEVGIDRDFVIKRIVPAPIASLIRAGKAEDMESLCYQIATHISRIFTWSPKDIFGSARLQLDTAAANARFKMPKRVNEQRVVPYVIYANYIAQIVLKANICRSPRPISTDPYALRKSILSSQGDLRLEHVIHYLCDHGISVIPLSDPGIFHGACFRKGGRNIIILKQRTPSASRWLFDLIHEVWHAMQKPEEADRTIIDKEDIFSPRSLTSETEETIASQFAGAVLLGKNPQRLAELCIKEAGRDLRRLKIAVRSVASKEDVPIDSLANYVAFRLSLMGENWWGTASNLQQISSSPWLIARDFLLRHIDFSRLDEPDIKLLQRAIAH